MKIIGLDFDNTLITYDELFYKLSLEKNLIKENFSQNKIAIRDYLRSKGEEEKFTLLQGEVYGLRIEEAKPAQNMIQTLYYLKQKGYKFEIVSHKTKKPYAGPPYDLRKAAMKWLEKNNFFNHKFLNLSKNDIYFAETKTEKINKINQSKFDYYIDDLPDILERLDLNIKGILYCPNNGKSNKEKYIFLQDWSKLKEFLI